MTDTNATTLRNALVSAIKNHVYYMPFVWGAFLLFSLWMGWQFSAGIAACSMIYSIFWSVTYYFENREESKGDEE